MSQKCDVLVLGITLANVDTFSKLYFTVRLGRKFATRFSPYYSPRLTTRGVFVFANLAPSSTVKAMKIGRHVPTLCLHEHRVACFLLIRGVIRQSLGQTD